jgi:GNAT superfamily N-acetyltransferase
LAESLAGARFVKTGRPCYDVERDLVDYAPPVEPSATASWCKISDRPALDAFLVREFPGRWRDDVLEKFAEDPSRIAKLVVDDQVAGFAMTQMEGDEHRRAGAVWSHDLGRHWAVLGPIGVARALRGEGHGHGLLAWALCQMRDHGARRTIIDWTTLTSFYGRHGFEPTRQYDSWVGTLTPTR